VITDPVTPVLRPVVRAVIALGAALTRPDWRDVQKIPRSGGVILVANHISNADPLVLGSFVGRNGRYPQFLAKASLFEQPVLGRLLAGVGQIPVQRGSAAAGDALEHAVAAIDRGGCVVIYPEGTITTDPTLWPMRGKTGAARLALRTGCPVIPVGQWGAQEILYGKRIGLPRILPRKRISMLVGDPVPLDDLRAAAETPDAIRQATVRIMAAITELVAELRDSAPPPLAYDHQR
jgi:1-acyl-sn-glycerol-3-phosphate acyltransferase